MKNNFRHFALRLAAVIALSCQFFAKAETNPASGVETNDFAGQLAYKIGPQDILSIKVSGEDKLTGDYPVSSIGTVSIYLIGEVKVGGMSPPEAEAKVKTLLEADYFVHAYVQLFVKTFRTRVVNVIGQVQKPGVVEFDREKPLNVVEAITRAGGLSPLAKSKTVQITRKGKKITFDLKSLLTSKDNTVLPLLEEDDIVFIPETVF